MAPTDDQLRALCHSVEAKHPAWVDGWRREAAAFLREIAQTPVEQRSTREFQRKLWESEAITSTSMGSVKIDAALDDADFRQWFAHEGMAPLPEGDAARAVQLKATFDRLVAQFDGDHRTPWLKILRVLAALYPTEFTSLASRRLLHELAGQLLDAPPRGPIAANRAIVARLDSILGELAPDDYEGLAARMGLPWLLHLHLGSEAEEPTEVVDEAGHTRLRPLPAARRRKGLTAFKGYFQSMLAILQGVEGGVTREDFIDLLRSERPGKKDSSHGTTINVLQGEFGVIHREGELYQLTPTGRAVLETGDPDELAEWLLTRVLGVDLALLYAREHGPMTKTELKRAIQKANPGWTGLFVPSAITSWLEHLGLLEQSEQGWSLSERGQAWAAQIHWEPAVLEVGPEDEGEDEAEVELEASVEEATATIRKPGFNDILGRLTYRFPPALVAELHAGLWAHPRRHFAVFTGLSGAGKTQLARQYGLALAGGDEAARKRVKIVAVQPGWYDPGPLLGYINPIQPRAYVRTPVLEFLRRAVAEPAIPYVLILDEMNLSRPEQYLAPLLSAMETGDPVDLHSEGDVLDGVERRIPYPSNLVIIGTVNMDETTHGLSDKVLDRAFTLEFWDIDLADYAGWDRLGLPAAQAERLRGLLGELMQALVPARLHFGWRVVDDIVDFLARNHEHGGQLEFTAAVDAIVYAKIVPKLRGDDSPRFRAALEQARTIAERNRLTRCHTKLTELEHDLRTTGSARFWR